MPTTSVIPEVIAVQHQPCDEAAPDAAERQLWTVAKGGILLECHVRHTPTGPELRICVVDEVWWSRVYPGASPATVLAVAEEKRSELVAQGWIARG